MRDLNVVDLFAGGGGASTGIEWAGGHVAVAVNHDPEAVAMHAANHPDTEHHCKSVFDVAPFRPGGREIDLLWASPDCTHHSRAKGGKPCDSGRRDLAWVVVDWAREVLPTMIALENVPEFLGWGPLYASDHEDESLRDRPIPERKGETFREFVGALEGLGYAVDWRPLRACDYGTPTTRDRLYLVARRDGVAPRWPEPSHGPGRARPWRTAGEVIDWSIPCPSIFDRRRPLAEATQRRIAEGLRRFVFETASPFLVTLTHGGRIHDTAEPMRTITAAHRGERAICVPSLIQTGYGERPGQAPRALDLGRPLGTVVACGAKHALISAFLAKHYTGVVGHTPDRPLGTVTAIDHHAIVAASLTKFYGTSSAASLDDPAPTVTAKGNHLAVAAFVLKYYGEGSQHSTIGEPLHTIVTKARHGLVQVELEGESYALTDIGMRMLTPRELAAAQGFPDSYELTGSKTSQIARIGNSVCPQVAEAIVRANLGWRLSESPCDPPPSTRRPSAVTPTDGPLVSAPALPGAAVAPRGNKPSSRGSRLIASSDASIASRATGPRASRAFGRCPAATETAASAMTTAGPSSSPDLARPA
jgi:DNA (cytosine-5)-methyltransferase 1